MNKIKLAGTIFKGFELSYEACGEKFYSFTIGVSRLSKSVDLLNCVIPESLLPADKKVGDNIALVGEIRTRNTYDDKENRHLEVYVFITELEEYVTDQNYVEGEFIVAKLGELRDTPLGRRIIGFILNCDRPHSTKRDYIPTIAWGRAATRISNMLLGTRLKVYGRLQSREYTKHIGDKETYKMAYEMCMGRFEEV